MEPSRHRGRVRRAPMLQRLLLLMLVAGSAQGLTIKPLTGNSFTNETITFTSDTPVRWNVVPRHGRPNFFIVMENLLQIRIRAGNIGAFTTCSVSGTTNAVKLRSYPSCIRVNLPFSLLVSRPVAVPGRFCMNA